MSGRSTSKVRQTWRVLMVAGLLSGGLGSRAVAVSDPVGVWTLSMPGTARQCRVQFRADAAATGQAISMPPGCRRAFPILAPVRSWSVPDGAHLALNDDVGANILMFDETGDGRLQAPGPESEASYMLTALGQRREPVVASPPALATDAIAAAPAMVPTVPRVRAAALSATAVAGHYAVMRGPRDTGCMVTLDDPGRTDQPMLKARLAPACRDQGIIVFDPVGWSLKSGHLVLSARKGHTAAFTPDDGGIWIKDGGAGQPLGLKRL